MRLLRVNKEQLTFESVPSHGPFPEYAILSHTWILPTEAQPYPEVSLQDLQDKNNDLACKKPGWSKVQNFIRVAQQQNIELIWIDTCCIDQQNPTELTEAINCMFRWYQYAKLCCAFLEDHPREPFSRTRWMKRGFTLQELIAPSALQFYDSEWGPLKTREDCAEELAAVTGVDVDILKSKEPTVALKMRSMAKRMSWAARRETTRPEDRAYSLFGLFDITMPTHYGEGEQRAFTRLQEEIVKVSADQSLFAWEIREGETNSGLLFAPSPKYFEGRGHVEQSLASVPVEYHMNNRGLEISIQGFRTLPATGEPSAQHQAILDCRSANNPSEVFILNLYPAGQGEYCISPRSALRCKTIDWLSLQQSQRMKSFPRRKITITRDASLSRLVEDDSAGPQPSPKYPKIRFQLLGPDRFHYCAQPYPLPWASEGLHCQPRSSDGLGSCIIYRWVDHLQVERRTSLVVALACDALDPVDPTLIDDPLDASDDKFVTVPALYVGSGRDDTTEFQASREDDYVSAGEVTDLKHACSTVGSMTRCREDPLLCSLPIVHTRWTDNHTCFQVKLDQADIVGERMWVVQVKLLHSASLVPRIQSTVWTRMVHPVVFLFIGWDIRNAFTDDISLSTIAPILNTLPQDMTPLLLKAAFMMFRFYQHEEPIVSLRSLIVYTSSLHVSIFKSGRRLNRTLFSYWSATPRALARTDSSIYHYISSAFGSTYMYRQWELMAYIFYFLAVWRSEVTWRTALVDFLGVTISRDRNLLMNFSIPGPRVARMAICWALARIIDGSSTTYVTKVLSLAQGVLCSVTWTLLLILCVALVTLMWLSRHSIESLAELVKTVISLNLIPLILLRRSAGLLERELELSQFQLMLHIEPRRPMPRGVFRSLLLKLLPLYSWSLRHTRGIDVWDTWAFTLFLHVAKGRELGTLLWSLISGAIWWGLTRFGAASAISDLIDARSKACSEDLQEVLQLVVRAYQDLQSRRQQQAS